MDYPDVAYEVAKAVASGRSDHGILICGSGIGMSIVANKVSGIRAALCCDVFSAQKARQHNDANVLCLSAGTAERGLALEIVKAYLLSTFEGGRHSRRIERIHGIEASSLDNS